MGLKAPREKLGDRFMGGHVLNTATRGRVFSDRLASLLVNAVWEP